MPASITVFSSLSSDRENFLSARLANLLADGQPTGTAIRNAGAAGAHSSFFQNQSSQFPRWPQAALMQALSTRA
jgi:hypothetical protein